MKINQLPHNDISISRSEYLQVIFSPSSPKVFVTSSEVSHVRYPSRRILSPTNLPKAPSQIPISNAQLFRSFALSVKQDPKLKSPQRSKNITTTSQKGQNPNPSSFPEEKPQNKKFKIIHRWESKYLTRRRSRKKKDFALLLTPIPIPPNLQPAFFPCSREEWGWKTTKTILERRRIEI